MSTSVTSPADVANLALVRLGRTERVGNLFDGTPAAKRILDIYGQTRDAVLTELDWDFAERTVALTLLKTAPPGGYVPPTVWSQALYPALPWYFEYAYPTDCLQIRSLRQAPLFSPSFDPKPVLFDQANDNTLVPPGKVILTNLQYAIAVYTARVTDPATWDAQFVEAIVAALARRLAVGMGGIELLKVEAQDEGATIANAQADRG